tara:strand:- start:1163 stop:1435 length:273 start_codon:yes stop_codon:yes gene_type:complete
MTKVLDNSEKSRFELLENGEVAFADYRLSDGQISIPYVESPVALRGTGAAGRLMEGVVTHARERELKIVPICGYAVSWFKRHPEHQSILA